MISAVKLTEFSRTNLSIISVVKFNVRYCLAGNAVKANLDSALAFNISGESGSAITEIRTSYIDPCAVCLALCGRVVTIGVTYIADVNITAPLFSA